MKKNRLRDLTPEEIASKILTGDTVILGQAITLVESDLPSDQAIAQAVIHKLLPRQRNSIRIGITGVPGVGKSTFIEVLGKLITALQKKVAVLAVDPSSSKTGGSILGDKTRMPELSKDPFAFIRPSATRTSLGGVNDYTRESILLCEAAGFDVIIVETVGVGQSEIEVRGMVDFFLLLVLAGAGDELQGIKKGIMEMADGIVITKADGDNEKKANLIRAELQQVMHLFPPADSGWATKVLCSSAIEKKGIEAIWQMILEYKSLTEKNSYFQNLREQQNLLWFNQRVERGWNNLLLSNKSIQSEKLILEEKIKNGEISPTQAATYLITAIQKQLHS